jgi:hypothetical protein
LLAAAWRTGRPERSSPGGTITSCCCSFQDAAERLLTEETAVLRLYVTGERDADGRAPAAATLDDAFLLLRLEVLAADKAGVFKHPLTGKRFSVYLYEIENQKYAELSYLDDTGRTVLRVIDNGDTVKSEADPPLSLGGRLMLYEMRRRPLITLPVIQNQKALNLAKIMLMRNVNMAGSRERWFFNTQPPGEWVDDQTTPGGRRFVAAPLKVGAGTSNFPRGVEIRDESTDELKGYANPNLQVLDPVEVDSFTKTRADFYESMLGQCAQRYALISGDATASGKSRIEARSEFEKSLTKTKTVLDAGGRWLISAARDMAADLAQRAGEFLDFRAEFNTIIDTGPVSPEERNANREDYKARMLSLESALTRNGVDDTDAEMERIKAEPAPAPEPAPVPPGGGAPAAA